MKKIYILVIIFLLSSCTSKVDNIIDDYNYLENNSVRFIRINDETSILINKDYTYYLLLINEPNIDIEVDYLIKCKDVKTSIESDEEYILTNNIIINNLEFKINDKIEIILDNHNICIYIKELDKNNYEDCSYIYLYNPDKNFYITINSELLGLFYHSYTKFNYKFMHHLSTVWIDSFTIDASSYTTLTIEDSTFNVTSNKVKGRIIYREED